MVAIPFATRSLVAQNWTVGLKGGVGKGWFTGEHEFEWKPSPVNAAAFFQKRMGDHLSFQPEIGVSEKLGVSTVSGTLTFTADQLDFPILFRYSLFGQNALRPYFLAGPTFSYRFNCSLKFVVTGIVSDGPCDGASLNDKLDFGAAGGVGLSKTFGRTTLHVEGRVGISARSVVVPLESFSSRGLWWNVMAGASVPLRFSLPGRGVTPNAPAPALPRMQSAIVPPQEVPSSPTLPGEILGAQPRADSSTGTLVNVNAKRVTMTAQDADARSLLIAVAKAAGVSLVVSNDVKRKVSLSLTDAPADEAIAAIIAQAGLSVSKPMDAVVPVVYYQLPVNVNEAPAETIEVRFGVSSEMAKWLLENRTPRPF